MEAVYKILTTLPNSYTINKGSSTIKIIYKMEPHIAIHLEGNLNDIEHCLKSNNIKYEMKVIQFFSEYPSFLIYENDKNIGIVSLNFSF
jgi:hypothetical protein